MLVRSRVFNNVIIKDFEKYNNFNFSINVEETKENKYFTELLLITNKPANIIIDWLNWHLNIIKVDHIVLINNTNDTDSLLSEYIDEHKNKIQYIKLPGNLNQAELYTEYVNNSEAEWVLPIDDDEFLYISKKFNHNLNEYLNYLYNKNQNYKYSFCWHMLFNKNMAMQNGPFYFIKNNLYTILDFEFMTECTNLIKTIVNTKIKHLYINENKEKHIITLDNNYTSFKNDKLGTVHNPISKIDSKFIHSYNEETDSFYAGILFNKSKFNLNSDCYIAHYKYGVGDKLYNEKIKNFNFIDAPKEFITSNYNLSTLNIIKNTNTVITTDLYNLVV